MMKSKLLQIAPFSLLLAIALWPGMAMASTGGALPAVSFAITPSGGPQGVVSAVQIIVLLTVLSLAPAILIMMTAFTRIVVVLSFVRGALSLQQSPPNQVLIGLALFLLCLS